ncbi:hypothetical protein, partial [Enterococcus casseliflavus]|uniref:hypothetical protein n=1 Tax=Enterococcus casseliflavus TaxID=37734 RepID=UPI003D0C6F38
ATDLDIPSSGRAAVLRVGISSSDETLVARLKEALTSHNVPFDVLAHGENGLTPQGPRYWARIQDVFAGEVSLLVGDV